jgi:hypothetical protein
MTVDNMPRASPTPSSTPDMRRTPGFFTLTKKERNAAREDVRDEINRCLTKDKQAIWGARGQVRKFPGWDDLSADVREQKMKEAAHSIIQQRKDRRIHVSSFFPEFRNYLPPIANDRVKGADEEVVKLTNRQLDLLGNQRAHARAHAEEDDDEEMPASLKKQEGEQPQELAHIPAYVPKCKARPVGDEKAAQQHRSSNANFEKMPKSHEARPPPRRTTRKLTATKKDSEEEDDDEDDSEAESDLGYDSDDGSDSDSEDAEDAKEQCKKRKAIFPMVAVRRGLALLKDTPTNATPTAKHRFSTIVEGGRKAVLRGRVAGEADEASDGEWTWVEKKGWTLVKKRACEDESESDVRDCNQVSKKAKVEAES